MKCRKSQLGSANRSAKESALRFIKWRLHQEVLKSPMSYRLFRCRVMARRPRSASSGSHQTRLICSTITCWEASSAILAMENSSQCRIIIRTNGKYSNKIQQSKIFCLTHSTISTNWAPWTLVWASRGMAGRERGPTITKTVASFKTKRAARNRMTLLLNWRIWSPRKVKSRLQSSISPWITR